MNKRLPVLLCAWATCWIAAVFPVLSQTPESLPDPLTLRIPEGMAATVTARRVKPLSEAEVNDPIRQSWNPDLVSATITRSGRDLVILFNWEGNKRSAVVSVGDNVLYQPSLRYPDDVQRNGDGAPELSRSDFPWLSWIDRSLFVQSDTVAGRPAYQFSRTPPENDDIRAKRRVAAEAAADAGAKLKPEHRQAFIESFLASHRREELAWLDPSSLLPVKSTDGAMEYTYSYRRATSADVQLPPEFLRAIEAMRKAGP